MKMMYVKPEITVTRFCSATEVNTITFALSGQAGSAYRGVGAIIRNSNLKS